MDVEEWFERYRYKSSSFANLKRLEELKKKQKQSISVVIPTLNEEKTVGKIIDIIQKTFMQDHKF